MDRRTFIAASAAAAAATGAAATAHAGPRIDTRRAREPFKLKYAPHFGMFQAIAGADPVAQLEFIASEGFTALEDNGMAGRPVEEQERIAAAMSRLGLTMGVFVANFGTAFGKPSFTSGRREYRENFVEDCRRSVEVAKRVNARWMTVVLGDLAHNLDLGFQTANAIDMLRAGAAVFEPHGLVMVLEPLNFRDHAGMFLSRIPQAYAICRAVDSPACKILFDIYHQQISEGNLIPNIDSAWSEIAYFQIGDNPGRREPTTGEINYRNVFRHIHSRGFAGVLGMEHGNSRGGADGERAVIEAYRQCDAF